MLSLFKSKEAPKPEINATRVYLRYPVESDFSQWRDLRENSKAHLTPFEPKWAVDETEKAGFDRRLRIYYRLKANEAGHSFFIFEKDTDMMLGGITLSNIRKGDCQSGSVGYWLGQEHCGKGYMLESLISLSIFAFTRIKLRRLEGACVAENTASHKLLIKAGFQKEGELRDYFRINDEWRDHTLYAKLASDPVIPGGPTIPIND